MKKSLPPYVYKKTVKGRDYFYFDHAGDARQIMRAQQAAEKRMNL